MALPTSRFANRGAPLIVAAGVLWTAVTACGPAMTGGSSGSGGAASSGGTAQIASLVAKSLKAAPAPLRDFFR